MARVLFWICGKCGFRNHPRIAKLNDPPIDDQLCEQCGTAVDDQKFGGLKFVPSSQP